MQKKFTAMSAAAVSQKSTIVSLHKQCAAPTLFAILGVNYTKELIPKMLETVDAHFVEVHSTWC